MRQKLEFEKEVNLLNEYMHFLKQTNKGGEFMDDKIFNGQCNLCHGTGIEDRLEME